MDDDFEEAEDDGELECSGCEREKDSCACADLLVQGLERPKVAGYCAICYADFGLLQVFQRMSITAQTFLQFIRAEGSGMGLGEANPVVRPL